MWVGRCRGRGGCRDVVCTRSVEVCVLFLWQYGIRVVGQVLRERDLSNLQKGESQQDSKIYAGGRGAHNP